MKQIRPTPDYYNGKNGYEASQVIYGFSCSYNVGNSVTYLLRAGKKKDAGLSDMAKHIEDLEKAIHHLQIEIKQLQIDDLMSKGMSYEKAKASLQRIEDLKNKFNKK